MSGHYPPGCMTNDADSPAAQAWEAALDELVGVDIDPVLMVQVVKALAPVLTAALATDYRSGYNDGYYDAEAKHGEPTPDNH